MFWRVRRRICCGQRGEVLAKLVLSVAGLMSDAPLEVILKHQRELLDAAGKLGIHTESDPFITLSFIALPVIPDVRLTDMGLFNVKKMVFFDKQNL
jgi:adenine deaminase